MRIVRYKGYKTRIKFCGIDNIFYGCVEDLESTLLSFEGETEDEAEQEFKNCIDGYLLYCERADIVSERPTENQL